MGNNFLQINAKQYLNLDLDDDNLRLFEIYYQLVEEWNSTVNLTAISGYDEFMLKHILDSLVLNKWLNKFKDTSIDIVDVGTGAGFPGLPIKIINPAFNMWLIESNQKKTKFLNHVVDTLNLNQVTIINDRSESISKESDFREAFDVVLGRGISRIDVLSELTLGLLKIGGIAVFHKGNNLESELKESLQSINLMGGELKSNISYQISSDRFGTLVIIDKINKTPDYLPRNPGIPVKRPLNNRFRSSL